MQNETRLHVLLIEDDDRLAGLTRTYLEGHGILVTTVNDGLRGLREALAHRHDAILLDIMLPGMDGIRICQKIREQSDVPVIMLTARGEEADRVMGLEIGADDYMPKPFSARELLARIRAVVRRAHGKAGPRINKLSIGGLTLDPAAARAELHGKVLDLTSYEFSLLHALAERAGRILSRDQLMDIARTDPELAFDRSIDVHISRLRKKLGDDPQNPRRIKTIRGLGYLFIAEPGEETTHG
jgi:two-component system, OmpR family, response regulator